MSESIMEMVEDWLKMHGYKGLYKPGYEDANDQCGCQIGDLMPCREPICEGPSCCQPGYLHKDGFMYPQREPVPALEAREEGDSE